jgi:SAM-dependent methyltransferase
VVIGDRFAWGHLEKTGGDATLDFFLAIPELIRTADPPSSEEKHCSFPEREAEIAGKTLALNIRRLPGWMLSKAHHFAWYGVSPDFQPLPMLSPQQMAESSDGDQRLAAFTGNGRLEIDRWLRMEFLVDDFLAFISELTEVSESKRQQILELASEHRGTPLEYDHAIDHWFNRDQLKTMYENNPVWASVEEELYGMLKTGAAGRSSGSRSTGAKQRASRLESARLHRRRARPVADREHLAEKARSLVEERWRRGEDWAVEPSELDRVRLERQYELLKDRRYERVLELGCGEGLFTRRLADIADHVIGIDVAPSAIARARGLGLDPALVEFQVASIMEYDPRAEGPWDLVVMSETIHEQGWLYPMFDVGWLASELFAVTITGGRFLMANPYGREHEHLLSPWLIDTYRDLFVNVGYRRVAEEIVRGTRHKVEYETLVTLYSKPE